MQPVAFCKRCRGMKVGLNQRYVIHCLRCMQVFSKASKLFILSILISILILSAPATGGLVVSEVSPTAPARTPSAKAAAVAPSLPGLALATIEDLLDRYQVNETHKSRVAEAILKSSVKHDMDPRLVASITIIESRANPFAISEADSVGVMQVHIPTWGRAADEEGVNLFNVEDNIDFGVRILKTYVRRYGVWDGVKRYKGWFPNPTSEQNADEYVQKVQRIYGYQDPAEDAAQ